MSTRDLLDPQLAATVASIEVSLDAEGLARLRRSRVAPSTSDRVARHDHVVPGDVEVPVRVHRPIDVEGPLPALFWIHGGGYVVGTHLNDDPMFEDLCPRLGIVGVTVGYRLAPEVAYPGAIEDCYLALRWTVDHATELGVRPDRIGIGGVSAGGGLAAALALMARERGGPGVAFQLLDSPMLDDRQITPSSQQDDMPMWSRESNRFGWQSYLGARYGDDDVPVTAAPARATDLTGLPPTFVSVGGLDGFVDEDVDYAMRLNRTGVPTELHVYPGACHGYRAAPKADVTRQSQRDRDDWLRRQLSD